jgi:DNA-directed RNA polymerase specialized sigma24 family protein
MTTTRRQEMPAVAHASIRSYSIDVDLTARFVRAVVPLRERLCRHAFGLTHGQYEAEDLVQETYAAFQSFPLGANLNGWRVRIMINSHVDQCRRHGISRCSTAPAS